MSFTADHKGFYQEGAPFYPWIQLETAPLHLESHAVAVRLPASLESDLNWSAALQEAAQVAQAGKLLFWELELGLETFVWRPDDLTSFHAFCIAFDQFTTAVWPLFKEQTLGVSLYRGAFDPSAWRSEEEPIDLFADYLHRLISCLPAEVLAFACVDVAEEQTFFETAHRWLQGRFDSVILALKGAKGPHAGGLCWEEGWLKAPRLQEVTTGVLLPAVGADVKEFRLVCADKLTEQWDGLDRLILPPASQISGQTRRKLQGFVAAGGVLVEKS